MSAWLLSTGLLELANVLIFTSLLAVLDVGPRSAVAVLLVDVILIVGGAYWLSKWAAIGRNVSMRSIPSLLRAARSIIAVLLVLGLVALLVLPPRNPADAVFSWAMYLFAVLEYTHYFFRKLNMRPGEAREALRTRRLPQARLARELERAAATRGRRTSASSRPTHARAD